MAPLQPQRPQLKRRASSPSDPHALQSQNWAIGQLPGLSTTEQSQLTALGIQTTFDLLRQVQHPENRQRLIAQLQIHNKYLLKWTALADLARVPGVGCIYCGLLLHAGISSVARLAEASAHRLHPQLLRLHVTVLHRRDLTPSAGQVAQWIYNAKLMQACMRLP